MVLSFKMEENMDVVHESIAEVDSEENNSISLKELSQSIDEVAPDIFLFFTPPFNQGTLDQGNNEYSSKINNDIYNEIMNNKIAFMCSQSSLQTKAASLCLNDNSDITMKKNSEIDTRSLPGDDISDYFNAKWESNDNDVNMSLNMHQKKKVSFNEVISVGDSLQSKQKVVTRHHQNKSDLIQMYCYKCKITTMNFIDKKCLICDKPLLFQCKNCTCVYKRLIIIQNHIKYECYKERIFKCAECDYNSISKVQLRKHVRNEHMVVPEKGFECLKCHRKFKIESNMLAHEKICIQGMTIQCRYCTFKTKINSNFIIHMESKHPELKAGNDHKCPDCGTKLMNKKLLNEHIRNLCGKKLMSKCDHCDHKINSKYDLAKHMNQQHPRLFMQNKF